LQKKAALGGSEPAVVPGFDSDNNGRIFIRGLALRPDFVPVERQVVPSPAATAMGHGTAIV
jgi:hypothetical protein